MGNINYTVETKDYQPSTILYAQDLKDNFNSLNNVLTGIILALNDYYTAQDAEINSNSNPGDIKEILENCLQNLLKTDSGAFKDYIKINRHNTSDSTHGGIELSHQDATNITQLIKITDSGIEINSSTLDLLLKRGSNTVSVTNTADRVDINGKNLVYSVSDAESNSSTVTRINKLYYDSVNKTIHFE